jgi:hypothetical protein
MPPVKEILWTAAIVVVVLVVLKSTGIEPKLNLGSK